MRIVFEQRSARFATALMAATLAVMAGCVHASTAPVPTAKTVVHTEPISASAPPAGAAQPVGTLESPSAAPLPSINTSAPALTDAPARLISSLVAAPGTPLSSVITKLGTEYGLNVSVDPAVQGTVTANLHNVSLDEALQELVRKNGYSYQLQGRTLRVTPMKLKTQIFTLDYVAINRVGTANTVIQRRLSTAGSTPTVGTAPGLTTSSPGAGAAGVPGGDVISATNISDLWTELRITLSGLLSRGMLSPAPGSTEGAMAANPGQTSAAQANANISGGAYATTWPDGTALTLSPASGLITVTATDDKLADVQTYLDAFKSSVLRQVLIEAKIVEVQLTKQLQYGIDWSVVTKNGNHVFNLSSSPASTTSSGQTGNVTFSLSGGATQINAVLNALESQGDVKVLSDARTSALNNQRAVFDVTTDEVFFANTRQPILGPTGGVIAFNDQVQAQTISVGIVLDVLPQISSDNVLTMNIRPVVTSLDRTETFTSADGTTASFPVTSRREGDTMARVRNGETIIIGGLMQTQHNRTVSGIPVLDDIPLIGRAFRHVNTTEQRVELVVFLTPTVVAGQPGVGR